MPNIGCQIDRAALRLKHRQILRKTLKVPLDAAAQDIQGHAFNLREISHRPLAVLGFARRNCKAAVTDHRCRNPKGRRWPDIGVPGNLRVKVGVAVDDPGHQGEAISIDDLPGLSLKRWPQGRNLALVDRKIAAVGRRSATVKQQRAAD